VVREHRDPENVRDAAWVYHPHLYVVKEDSEPPLQLWALSSLIQDRYYKASMTSGGPGKGKFLRLHPCLYYDQCPTFYKVDNHEAFVNK